MSLPMMDCRSLIQFCRAFPPHTNRNFVNSNFLDEPLPYIVGFLVVVLGLILGVFIDMRLRRCGNPNCKGLRRAVEYDIQLETEACVKHSPPPLGAYLDVNGAMQLELGEDRKELEAELKKMAPLNGRTEKL